MADQLLGGSNVAGDRLLSSLILFVEGMAACNVGQLWWEMSGGLQCLYRVSHIAGASAARFWAISKVEELQVLSRVAHLLALTKSNLVGLDKKLEAFSVGVPKLGGGGGQGQILQGSHRWPWFFFYVLPVLSPQ